MLKHFLLVNSIHKRKLSMSNISNTNRKQIKTKIYACGGFAFNTLAQFQPTAVSDSLTHVSVNYIDTTASNMPSTATPATTYLFKNMDGGGKERRTTYPAVLPLIPDVLEKLPPEDFNIVVHSSSGGSGSSIGPALVTELLRLGKHVVVVQIGSVGSKKEVQNTIATIRSYANISAKAQRPVVSYYRENNEKATRMDVDEQVQSVLFMLCMLFSSENTGLDTADLENFLNYNKVTSFRPELSTFDFHCQKVELPENLVVQSAAILFSEGVSATDGHENGNFLVEYRAEGFLSENRTQQFNDKAPIFFLAYTGDFSARLIDLESRVKRFETAARAHSNSNLSVSLVDSTDDGMVF